MNKDPSEEKPPPPSASLVCPSCMEPLVQDVLECPVCEWQKPTRCNQCGRDLSTSDEGCCQACGWNWYASELAQGKAFQEALFSGDLPGGTGESTTENAPPPAKRTCPVCGRRMLEQRTMVPEAFQPGIAGPSKPARFREVVSVFCFGTNDDPHGELRWDGDRTVFITSDPVLAQRPDVVFSDLASEIPDTRSTIAFIFVLVFAILAAAALLAFLDLV